MNPRYLTLCALFTVLTACGGDDSTPSSDDANQSSAVTAPSSSDEAAFHAGRDSLNKKDFAGAEKQLTPLAEKGNAEAMYYLAETFSHYDNPNADRAKSMQWHEKAARSGHVSSAHILGSRYMDMGKPAKAMPWLTISANHCVPDGVLMLAVMYQGGEGVPKDPVEAYTWYTIGEIHNGADDMKAQLKKGLNLSASDKARAAADAAAFKCKQRS